ncbi:MAG: segregation/condensation protein A [Bdellovibrionales bacterium]|jgi:segregation and condensation protein A|nr:segregation/condensation protein A [Bdellovibrionales bacterium]MBT3526769.1 segregation/condensation protein A [Bdellovibrionales bacterium]
MLDSAIPVKTDNFDGPLGLLLHLIRREEMSIRDLDLTQITRQYLDYLDKMRELNFDLAGDYLYLAATLVFLKSGDCLGEDDAKVGELDNPELKFTSRSQLIQRLEELQHFQRVGEKLWSLPKRGDEIFCRPRINRKEVIDSILTPIDLEKLTEVMMDVMQREKRKFQVIPRERISIRQRIVQLGSELALGIKTDFKQLLEKSSEQGLSNIVITFISILEMVRLKKVSIFQNRDLDSIYIEVLAPINEGDLDVVDDLMDEG